jgi:hypothetical protein
MNTDSSMEYLKLRLAVQHRGSSIRRWARDQALPVGLVYNAARRERRGARARRILKRLEAFAYAQ